jgi:negative regulator of sigma E activity
MNMNINTNNELPTKPPVSETEMDEFESNKMSLKVATKNTLKMVKLAAVAAVVIFVVVAGIYALNMVNQSRNTQQLATPVPTVLATASPSPTPKVQYPEEYQNIESKINGYSQEINAPTEERVRLNPPAMNLSVTF